MDILSQLLAIRRQVEAALAIVASFAQQSGIPPQNPGESLGDWQRRIQASGATANSELQGIVLGLPFTSGRSTTYRFTDVKHLGQPSISEAWERANRPDHDADGLELDNRGEPMKGSGPSVAGG